MLQMRPRDGSDSRFYNPARDIAHLGIKLIRRALDDLATESMPHFLWHHCALRHRASEDDTGLVAEAIARYINAVTDKEVEDSGQAYQKSGLSQLERDMPEAVLAVYAAIGRISLPAIFSSMRDVNGKGYPLSFDPDELLRAAMDHDAWSKAPWWARLASKMLPQSIAKWLLTRSRRNRLEGQRERLRLWSE